MTTRAAAAVVVGLYVLGLAAAFGPPAVQHCVAALIFGV